MLTGFLPYPILRYVMKPDNRDCDVLTSWKEISAYLKCGIRSCIRWEKERGLPVHRMAEAPGSRVYAYKHELDDWLAAQLSASNNEVVRERKSTENKRTFNPLWPVLIILVTTGLFLLFRPRSGPAPFQTGIYSIITTEPASPGRIRVWQAAKSGQYKNSWGVTSSRYNTDALDDRRG
jgi:hypothetical protein